MKEVVGELAGFLFSNIYAQAIVILVIFLFAARLVLFFFKHVLERIVKKTPGEMDDKIVIKMETPIIITIVLIGIQLSTQKILTGAILFENTINSIIVFVLTYMFIGIVSTVISYWAKQKSIDENEEFHEEVQPLIKSLARILLITIGVVVVLQMWGVQVGTMLASVGVLGIVLGFAFQDTMKNIFGGISLITDDSLHKKDVIRLDTGESGEVVEVSLRSTKIRTFDNEFLIIPNGVLSNTKFVNLAEPTPTLRIDIPVSVAYGSDIDQVSEVLLETIKGNENVLKYPKREVRFLRMNDFSLDFMLFFHISNYKNKFAMENEVTSAIYKALRRHNIQVPFPARTIYEGEPIRWKKAPERKAKKKRSKKVAKKKSSKKATTKKSTKKRSTRKR